MRQFIISAVFGGTCVGTVAAFMLTATTPQPAVPHESPRLEWDGEVLHTPPLPPYTLPPEATKLPDNPLFTLAWATIRTPLEAEQGHVREVILAPTIDGASAMMGADVDTIILSNVALTRWKISMSPAHTLCMFRASLVHELIHIRQYTRNPQTPLGPAQLEAEMYGRGEMELCLMELGQ